MSSHHHLTPGQFVTGTPDRRKDAIHVAVAVVNSGHETFARGDHVQVIDGIAHSVPLGRGCAIVDPFLNATVPEHTDFLVFVYPGKVTDLRHEWSHPSFPDKIEEEREAVYDGCRGC